jgi:adenine-specific DNA-methyltransferase
VDRAAEKCLLCKDVACNVSTALETLPNIDINIKCGNSLVSRFAIDADLKQALKKSKWSITSYRLAVASYRNAQNKEEKREMERLIKLIKHNFASEISQNNPVKKRLDKLANELYQRFTGAFLFEPEENYGSKEKSLEEKRKKEREKIEKEIEDLNKKLEEIKNNKIFENAFEWRFEFPEVLNDDGDFVGFDAVIGNPPYIRQEELGEFKTYLKERFEVYAGTADILVYFFELSANILKPNGNSCMITSNKFVKANYGKNLRSFLMKLQLSEIIDFGELPVFEQASTFPAIYFFSKKPKEHPVKFTQISSLSFSSFAEVVKEKREHLPDEAFGEDFWSLSNLSTSKVLEKMKLLGVPLGDCINEEILNGIKTGFNKAFVISEEKKNELIALDPKSAEIIFPYAIGDDVRFYHIRDKKRFLILTKIGIDISQYPAILEHLKQYQNELEKRWDKGNHWWELRACAYYQAFENPKIVYPDIAKESRFAFSENTMYFGNTCYFLPTGDKALLAVLNSKAIWFYFSQIASVLGDAKKGGRLRWFSQDVVKIPIPSLKEKKSILENLSNQILSIKKQFPTADTTELETQIDQLVYELYGLTEEEIKIVEGK